MSRYDAIYEHHKKGHFIDVEIIIILGMMAWSLDGSIECVVWNLVYAIQRVNVAEFSNRNATHKDQ